MAAKFVIPSYFKAIDQMTGPLAKMQAGVAGFSAQVETKFARVERAAKKIGDVAFNIGTTFGVAGAAIIAPLGVAVNAAIKFEDKMSDVAKTTGLEGEALRKFGKDILAMSRDTRTSIDDIMKIAEIGGQLGIANSELLEFTESSNKFAVALGADYSGGVEAAISQVGKLKNLFKETRDIPIAEAITRAGSAINELGAVGPGTSENINEFMLRLGALPDAIKPSVTSSAALAAFFEEMGIDAQRGSSGLSNLLLTAGRNIGGFATQMGVTQAAAKELLATDPTAFAQKFAGSLSGLAPEKLATKLQTLKLGSQETIKVVGALGSGYERLNELQAVSANSFSKATSLQEEYNKKNETTAARIAKAQNNMQEFAITAGTLLLPMLTKLIDKAVPLIQAFTDWIGRNESLVGGVLKFTGVVGGLSLGISAVSFVIGAFTKAVSIAKGAMWLLNIAMNANPVGLIITAVAALIGLIVLVVKHWDTWGETIAVFIGPLGVVISLVQSFRRNWDLIEKAFKEGGIVSGLKMIGATIFDAILSPLQRVLELLAKLPKSLGGGIAADAAQALEGFRRGMGVDMTKENARFREADPGVYSPAIRQAQAVSAGAIHGLPALDRRNAEQQVSRTESIERSRISIDVNDPNQRTTVRSDNPAIPINLTPTFG